MKSTSNQLDQEFAVASAELVVFGEVLFDCFSDDRRVLGGAPFNVCWALNGFGFDPLLVSAVGADPDGDRILNRIKNWNMRDDGVQSHATLPTGQVLVTLNQGDAAYEIPAPVAWDEITDMNFAAEGLIYHGSLALRSETNRSTLKQIMERSKARRFYDVNLRPPHTPLSRVQEWAEGAAWVKCNLEELAQLIDEPGLSFEACDEAANRFRSTYRVPNLLVTAGSAGAAVFSEDQTCRIPSSSGAGKIVDTVGAGDSFSAVCIHGILSGLPIEETLERAGRFARKVCMMQGATTDDTAFYNLNKE